MTTALHLAGPDDLSVLLSLVQRRHEEAGQSPDPDHLRRALTPLCAGGQEGAAYLFGPTRAPVGYLSLTFAWSIDAAAPVARICDVYIRPSIRQRGLAATAVSGVARALRDGGIARIDAGLLDDAASRALAARCGFVPTDTATVSRRL